MEQLGQVIRGCHLTTSPHAFWPLGSLPTHTGPDFTVLKYTGVEMQLTLVLWPNGSDLQRPINLVWSHRLLIPALKRWKQGPRKFKVLLSYIAPQVSEPVLSYTRSLQGKKKMALQSEMFLEGSSIGSIAEVKRSLSTLIHSVHHTF